MNRRSFLKFCGIVPVMPGLLMQGLEKKRIVQRFVLTINIEDKTAPLIKKYIHEWNYPKNSYHVRVAETV